MMRGKKADRPFAEYGRGRHRVWAEVIAAGEDLVVFIGGGERPHIGSLSLASADCVPLSACIPGHKDYVVSSRAAKRVTKETGRSCVVVAGLHVEGASESDILMLLDNSEKCLDLLMPAIGRR